MIEQILVKSQKLKLSHLFGRGTVFIDVISTLIVLYRRGIDPGECFIDVVSTWHIVGCDVDII